MQLGYFPMPLHPPERDYPQTLKEDREAIILADRLGYAEAFVGEHVTDRAETITSCLVFIASLMRDTRRIKLGSGTVNLPNSHPAAVAAQVAMLDHLLEGRFLFGISPGGLRSDAEVFGNLDNDRTAMFVEAIDMVLKIWSTEPPYDLQGKFWKVTTERTLDKAIGQGVIVKPFQKPHPPIVVTVVAPFSKGVIAAAERGWTPIWQTAGWGEWRARSCRESTRRSRKPPPTKCRRAGGGEAGWIRRRARGAPACASIGPCLSPWMMAWCSAPTFSARRPRDATR